MEITNWLTAFASSDLIFVVSGLFLCLFGSIIFCFGTKLIGLGLGMGFGFFLGELTNAFMQSDENLGNFILLGFTIVGAVASLFIIKSITNLIFGILGFLFGLLLGRFGLELYSSYNGTSFELGQTNSIIIFGIAGAVAFLAILLQRYIMIFISSYIGSTFLFSGVTYLSERESSFMVILVFSIIWQTYILGRLFRDRKRNSAEN